MRLLLKLKLAIAGMLIASMLAPSAIFAESSYQGYIYDNLENTPLSTNGYLYSDSIDGRDMETGPLNGPEDLFIAPDDSIYIVDSGNNRVLHINRQHEVLGVYGSKEGTGKLNSPKGVYVTKEGNVYVADTLNRRIVVFDPSGIVMREYGAPESPLLGKDFVYSPSKLIVDKRGYLFVVSDGASQGQLQIRPDGKFAGFFGANHVDFSFTRVLVRLIATKEQRQQLASVRPPEFSNLFQDKEGFIYTTTLGVETNQIKRLSAVGIDTLNQYSKFRYGDIYMPLRNNQLLKDAFVDVTVGDTGIFTALDQTTGRLFQYNKLGNLLFIFGGLGDQNGLFKTPASVAQTSDGTIYVADRTRNMIDIFYVTPFAKQVHKASNLYVDGRYNDAYEPWKEVLSMNSNYDLAYFAIGKAFYRQQKYKEAMEYFRLARDKASYSDALNHYRRVWVREHFTILFTGVIALFIAVRLVKTGMRRRWFAKLTLSKRAGKETGIHEHT